MEPKHVAVSGLIGAGKSVFSTKLGKHLNRPVLDECLDTNPYLQLFYANSKLWCFHAQVHFLSQRFTHRVEQLEELEASVAERSCHEDAIFAEMLHDDGIMDDNAYNTYRLLFGTMQKCTPNLVPDMILFLDVKPETAAERIAERGRDCEKGISLDYLRSLHKHYQKFVSDMTKLTRVVVADWEDYDMEVDRVWAFCKSIADKPAGRYVLKRGE